MGRRQDRGQERQAAEEKLQALLGGVFLSNNNHHGRQGSRVPFLFLDTSDSCERNAEQKAISASVGNAACGSGWRVIHPAIKTRAGDLSGLMARFLLTFPCTETGLFRELR